jgi:hypothetical protein
MTALALAARSSGSSGGRAWATNASTSKRSLFSALIVLWKRGGAFAVIFWEWWDPVFAGFGQGLGFSGDHYGCRHFVMVVEA